MRHFKWTKVIATKQKKTCLVIVHVCVWFFPILLYYHNNSCNEPFVSTIWHQKEPLGCAVYSHCPTNDSYNNNIHSCCLPCNYVTKTFCILQRVIKSQRVHILEKKLKASVRYLVFYRMIVHEKGLDTKEKLKLTFLKLFDNESIFLHGMGVLDLPKLKNGSQTRFWCTFPTWFFHKMFLI